MKFWVTGAGRETGKEIKIVVEARDKTDAEATANRLNVLVKRVELIRTPDATPRAATKQSNAPSCATSKKQCQKCKEWIDNGATKCPHCRSVQLASPRETAIGAIVLIVALLWCSGVFSPAPTSSTSTSSRSTWYEGGTLQSQSALDWQDATYQNKLATCADFVAAMWTNNDLNPRIQSSINSMDDLKPYAQKLVAFLDGATKKDSDPRQNRQMYPNQTVAEMAAVRMVWMGWAKQ